MTLFMIWTTFVCLNGEIAGLGEYKQFTTNMYSSKLYKNKLSMNKDKSSWQRVYGNGKCIAFMIQDEDVTDKVLLKNLLRIY